MNMLTEALDIIIETVDGSQLFSAINHKIVNSVGVEKDGKPTNVWLAGLTQSRGSDVGKVNRAIEALNAERLDPESKEYRDAVRTKIAMEELRKNRMIGVDERGRYTFPQANTPAHDAQRRKLSDLRTFLTRDFHSVKDGNDTEKSFRDNKDSAVADMLAAMPPEQKRYADIYSTISVSAYNLLVNLYSKRGPKDVARLRDTMNSGGFKDSHDLVMLQNLGLVNDQKLLNRGEMTKFGSFMSSATPAQLMALNKEVASVTKSAQHSRQRTLNAAGKGNGPEDAAHIPDDAQYADDMNDDEQRAIKSRIRDIQGGTKASSKNDRAGGYNNTFSDIFRQSFD